MPHSFPVDISESLSNIRQLTAEQKKEARKRISALDKRDEDKIKSDEAKNEYESKIYEMRAWLQEDEHAVFVPEAEKDEMLVTLEQAEDWLYEDGADAGYKTYQSKSYDLASNFSKYVRRKEEFAFREMYIEKTFALLTEMRD